MIRRTPQELMRTYLVEVAQQGKHVGPWLGQAPTGAVIESTVFSFFELTAGRISRYRLWLQAGFEPSITFDSSRPSL
jgi:hypothetical protein